MSDDRDSLQVDEVVAAIRRDGECAVVHLPTDQEVVLYTDIDNPKEPWCVRTLFADVPERDVLRGALAHGFRLSSLESRQGSTLELSRNCFGDTAAATKALALVRLLPGVRAEDWLWVTAAAFTDRDVPPPDPPEVWPPRRASGT